MKRYPWPGNVRELENVVQRLVVMTDQEVIDLKSLPPDIAQVAANARNSTRFHVPPGGIKLDEEMAAYERRWLETALAQANQDNAQAARLLGLDRKRIYYLRRKYNLA